MKQNNAHIDLSGSSVKSSKDDPDLLPKPLRRCVERLWKKYGNKKEKKRKNRLDLLGISVYHLANDFLDEVRIKFPDSAEDTKIYEIEDLSKLDENGIIREKSKDATCPIDGRQGAAYVHTLQGDDHVGPSSIMLSYTWGYSIGDIIDVLSNYCTTNNLDPKEVYVWICCLCVNQHRVIEKKRNGEVVPFEEFESVFSKRVTSIGHILAMMAPW